MPDDTSPGTRQENTLAVLASIADADHWMTTLANSSHGKSALGAQGGTSGSRCETPPRVVGLDISLTGTGIACSAGWCDAIGINGVTTKPLAERDTIIVNLAYDITQHIGPETQLVVIEMPAYSRSGGGTHERSGLWWRVVHHLHAWEIPVVEVNSGHRCTYATGKWNAKKTEVVDAVARRWTAWQTHGDDNAADAVVLMAMGLDALGHPLATVPAKHRAALAKVTWPEMAVTPC